MDAVLVSGICRRIYIAESFVLVPSWFLCLRVARTQLGPHQCPTPPLPVLLTCLRGLLCVLAYALWPTLDRVSSQWVQLATAAACPALSMLLALSTFAASPPCLRGVPIQVMTHCAMAINAAIVCGLALAIFHMRHGRRGRVEAIVNSMHLVLPSEISENRSPTSWEACLAAMEADIQAALKERRLMLLTQRVFVARRSQAWGEDGQGATQCVVCLADKAPGERLLELQCGHSFHQECIQRWVLDGGSCPFRCAIDNISEAKVNAVADALVLRVSGLM